MTAHLPFLLGYSLSAAALSRLVVAHDCQNANYEDLTEMYSAKSEEEISDGLRWFYCGGLGVALISMGMLNLDLLPTLGVDTNFTRLHLSLAYPQRSGWHTNQEKSQIGK